MKKSNNQPSKSTKNSRWTKPYSYIIILAILTVFVYSKTSSFDFVHIDDGVLIHENPLVTNSNIPYSEVFKSKLYGPHYKPLTFLTWKAQYNSVGHKPGAFHTVNWILHLLNTVILFLIGIKLFQRLYDDRKLALISAFILAILFAINPLRLESVAWATERKDVLFSLFFLSSWYAYLYYIQKNKYLFLILGAVLYLLSGLSKSMGLTLVAVLFLTDLWYNRKIYSKTIIEKIPYFLVFGILIYLYGFIGGGSGSGNEVAEVAQSTSGQVSSLEFIDNLPIIVQIGLSASLRFILWILHSFVPLNLSVEYSYEAIFKFFSYSIFLFPMIIAGLYYYAWKIRKKSNVILGGLLFYAITISPVLVYSQSGQAAFLADRYTYIPCIGLFFITVYLLNKLRDNKAKQYMLTGGLILFFLALTLTNIGHWKNSETLFTQAIEVNPTSSLSHLNLGRYYREQNQANKAVGIYSKGISLAATPELYSNRGKIYFDQNNFEQALIDFNKSLALDPNYAEALANRGAIFGVRQDWENCINDLNKAIQIDPDNTNAIKNRGLAHLQQQNYEATIADFTRYLTYDPNESDIINTLGLAYGNSGDHSEAINQYNKAIRLNSAKGAYFYNRSLSYKALGNMSNALSDAQKARQLNFNVSDSYINELR
jgi:tetratricopeptide (TPR) repeat protein